MNPRRLINQSKLVFLGLFALACAGIWTYQLMYVIPGRKCEAAGRWWLNAKRLCGVPIEISKITGRANPIPGPAPVPIKPKAAPAAPAKP